MFHLLLSFCGVFVAQSAEGLHSQSVKDVRCIPENISSTFHHCTRHHDGVHDLDCFTKYASTSNICTWKPGKKWSNKKHTLVVQQILGTKTICNLYNNISDLRANFQWFPSFDVMVDVYEDTESANCTRATFRGSPENLVRCGPPLKVTFGRRLGNLDVKVTWTDLDKRNVNGFTVRYRAAGETSWSEAPTCQSSERCRLRNLNASQIYHVQIRCLNNSKCTQCPWSPTRAVLTELTQTPEILMLDEQISAGEQGRRTISLSWTLPGLQSYDGFHVTMSKASEEKALERVNVTRPGIRLVLSYSAYSVGVTAFNNVSVSPQMNVTVPRRLLLSDTKINISVHNPTSFTVHWGAELVRTYVCFSVELTTTQKKTMFVSFYESTKNFKTFHGRTEPLEPYRRYQLTLHTRPEKQTCDLKSINNSETTYASTIFYAAEGEPVSAPGNVSLYNITKTSAVLTWSSIPEEDLRGFLLGYMVYYSEVEQGEWRSEKSVSVDPRSDSCQLDDLRSGAMHRFQISGFTRAGIGVRSPVGSFKTIKSDLFSLGGIIFFAVLMGVIVTFGIFGSRIVRRAKVLLWPSLPDPGQSLTMQKMTQRHQEEYRETANEPEEEFERTSLQILEEEEAAISKLLPHQEDGKQEGGDDDDDDDDDDDEHSWMPEEDPGREGNPEPSPMALVFSRDYTTLEMFLRAPPAGVLMEHNDSGLLVQATTRC